MAANIMDFYTERIDTQNRSIASIESIDQRLSRARGIVFLFVLIFGLAWATGFGDWLLALSALAFVGFLSVLAYHEHVQRQLASEKIRRELAVHQLARIRRDWSELPKDSERPRTSVVGDGATEFVLHESVVADLDLYGLGSVWQLVNQASTPLGQSTLHGWLRCPAMPDEVAARQAAVQWLAKQPDFCQSLYLSGRMLAAARGENTEFLAWAEGGPWLWNQTNLICALRFLALAMLVLPIGLVTGMLTPGWWFVALAVFAINVVCNMIWIGKVHDLFNCISAGKYDMQYFTELFEAVASLPEDVPRLAELRAKMQAGNVTFATTLGKLQKVLRFANGRKSGLLGIPWLIAQILWFWDFHVLLFLESWQREFGDRVRHWFDAVGELEALASLATLRHDHPDWQFPNVDVNEQSVVAKQMGHALLPTEKCVRNDVALGPQGTFLLVTGSNMSGKSTLLRSLGVNTMLALAGGPVCAEAFDLPPVELATSMRISDSLNSGVSYFMAELKRVKEIVDRGEQLNQVGQPRMLYLLDEILQGTNSAERHVAVTRILRHLLGTRSIGAISTHDLELADTAEIKNDCQLVHLRETIEETPDGDRMKFDYIVREGVTPTTNALRLLELVGLGDPKSG